MTSDERRKTNEKCVCPKCHAPPNLPLWRCASCGGTPRLDDAPTKAAATVETPKAQAQPKAQTQAPARSPSSVQSKPSAPATSLKILSKKDQIKVAFEVYVTLYGGNTGKLTSAALAKVTARAPNGKMYEGYEDPDQCLEHFDEDEDGALNMKEFVELWEYLMTSKTSQQPPMPSDAEIAASPKASAICKIARDKQAAKPAASKPAANTPAASTAKPAAASGKKKSEFDIEMIPDPKRGGMMVPKTPIPAMMCEDCGRKENEYSHYHDWHEVCWVRTSGQATSYCKTKIWDKTRNSSHPGTFLCRDCCRDIKKIPCCAPDGKGGYCKNTVDGTSKKGYRMLVCNESQCQGHYEKKAGTCYRCTGNKRLEYS